MEIRVFEDLMIKSLLVAGLFLSGLPVRSGAGQPPVSGSQIAIDASGTDGDGWKADALKPLDLKIDGSSSETARSVAVKINRTALLAEVPMLQEHGALSKNITGKDVARQPASYTNVLSLLLTSYAVRNLYEAHPELGRTRWNVFLTAPTDTGDSIAREIYSFAFDRPLYERTAWDRLPFTEFPKVAAGFSYNLRFTLDMSHEVSGSIDED